MISMLAAANLSAQQLSAADVLQVATTETNNMAITLGLDAEQANLVKAAQQQYYQQLLALPKDLSPDDRSARINQLAVTRDAVLKNTLTPQQWTRHLQTVEKNKQAALQAIEQRRNKHRSTN